MLNDIDLDGGIRFIYSVSQPSNGTVVVIDNGDYVEYTPDAEYCNDGVTTDDFTYTLNGGSTATVAVTVNCDIPVDLIFIDGFE